MIKGQINNLLLICFILDFLLVLAVFVFLLALFLLYLILVPHFVVLFTNRPPSQPKTPQDKPKK